MRALFGYVRIIYDIWGLLTQPQPMKTYQEWEDGPAMSITEYLEPGDEVDEEMYDYFGGATTPHFCNEFFLQGGEPTFGRAGISHYMTFAVVKGDKYLYLGELPGFKQPKTWK
jgi:hypothetical protein